MMVMLLVLVMLGGILVSAASAVAAGTFARRIDRRARELNERLDTITTLMSDYAIAHNDQALLQRINDLEMKTPGVAPHLRRRH